MSFRVFTGHPVTEEVLDMLQQLSKEGNYYAISDVPIDVIRDTAKMHGYKVTLRTVGYHEVKVRLVQPIATDGVMSPDKVKKALKDE